MSPVFVAAIFLGLSALSSASEKKVDWIDLFWRRIDKLPNGWLSGRLQIQREISKLGPRTGLSEVRWEEMFLDAIPDVGLVATDENGQPLAIANLGSAIHFSDADSDKMDMKMSFLEQSRSISRNTGRAVTVRFFFVPGMTEDAWDHIIGHDEVPPKDVYRKYIEPFLWREVVRFEATARKEPRKQLGETHEYVRRAMERGLTPEQIQEESGIPARRVEQLMEHVRRGSSFGVDLPYLRRPLSSIEIREMQKVFGDSLPWKTIRVRGRNIPGSVEGYVSYPKNEAIPARTVTLDRLPPSGKIMACFGPIPGGSLLVHEIMHIWQDLRREGSRVGTGTTSEAEKFNLPKNDLYDLYRWHRGSEQIPFSQWPREAQAEAAAHYWNGLYFDPSNEDHRWYIRLPMVDRLFQHLVAYGEFPSWASSPIPRQLLDDTTETAWRYAPKGRKDLLNRAWDAFCKGDAVETRRLIAAMDSQYAHLHA
jgi:hypothetical protein